MNLKNLIIGLASMLPFVCGTALAACQVSEGGVLTPNNGGSPSVVTLAAFNAPNFDPGVPNGTVLYSQEVSVVQNGKGNVYCSNYIGDVYHGQLGPVDQYSTWPTGVAGIGVRMRFATKQSWWPEILYFTTQNMSFTASPLVVELVKTGRITVGGRMTGELAGSWVQGKNFQYRSIRISGSIELKPNVPTCSVTTKSINVQFGEVNINGTATAPERPVNIGLQCSGGTRDAKTRMYITLTDATNPGNRSDVLTLANTSTAKGVGVRIMNGTTPVKYGPDSSATGNPNQWFVTEAGNENINIPLSARYVRTSDTLKAGTANAIATFTMSYQ
ncbi:fimbrial protein [Burkholderia sp. MS455]|uniref:fimbrial protein n=1 Tax=Burkholderia sp. MS455 TaxID=2811788 RepID=UPI00195DB62F|nr:fimbrial protein [Burkholderia sp. MS455]QRR05963.1 fimbrial protein [Burkholderia sp. MS455]